MVVVSMNGNRVEFFNSRGNLLFSYQCLLNSLSFGVQGFILSARSLADNSLDLFHNLSHDLVSVDMFLRDCLFHSGFGLCLSDNLFLSCLTCLALDFLEDGFGNNFLLLGLNFHLLDNFLRLCFLFLESFLCFMDSDGTSFCLEFSFKSFLHFLEFCFRNCNNFSYLLFLRIHSSFLLLFDTRFLFSFSGFH